MYHLLVFIYSLGKEVDNDERRELIKLLISHGAKVKGDFKNKHMHNSSPLRVALKQYVVGVDSEVLEILLEAG